MTVIATIEASATPVTAAVRMSIEHLQRSGCANVDSRVALNVIVLPKVRPTRQGNEPEVTLSDDHAEAAVR
jgi:hypothetical protein